MHIERAGGPDTPRELPTSEQTPTERRAVICDRDAIFRSAVATILLDGGFEVVGQLADARDLVEMSVERRPDVVVLALDSTDADELLALKDLSAQRIAPVVVLAPDYSPALVAAVRDAGALAYLTKPPTSPDLVPAVEVAIARFAETSRLAAEVAAANHRLEARKLIDRAKGLLMAHRRISEPEAFRWIQRTAMDRRKTSTAVAAQVIAELGDDRQQHRAAS